MSGGASGFRRIGKDEGSDPVLDDFGDRLQLRQRLEAALRLAGLRGLVAEAVDERLHVPALLVLLLLELHGQRLLLAPLPLELS